MRGIFVSYRRSDSASATGRLYDHLKNVHGGDPGALFIDIDDVPIGADFREVIRATLIRCDVMVVVIGKTWLDAKDDEGNSRLASSSDTHRLEVATALASDTFVIPVLVEGARHPAADKLPEDLSDLAFLNSVELTQRRFGEDVRLLGERITEIRNERQRQRDEAARETADEQKRAAEEAKAQELQNQLRVEEDHRSRDEAKKAAQAKQLRELQEHEARLKKEEAEANYYSGLSTKRSRSVTVRPGLVIVVVVAVVASLWILLWFSVAVVGVVDYMRGTPREGTDSAGDAAGIAGMAAVVFNIPAFLTLFLVYRWRRNSPGSDSE